MRKKDLTKFKTPHTYAIIFVVVLICWFLTFLIPAGKFSTHDVEYKNAAGEIDTRTVLQTDTFRYMHPLNKDFLAQNLGKLYQDKKSLEEKEIDQEAFAELLKTPADSWDQGALDKVGLTDDTLYGLYGDNFYDNSVNLNKTAKIWGTDDFNGFGFLNYLFEGLVSGDKYGSAVGIVALLLVVGGAFGIIMATGAIDAGIYAVINKTKGLEKFAIPIIFYLFSLGGATFGMSEEVIPFSMVMVPFVIALGYDSIVAVTVTFVASQLFVVFFFWCFVLSKYSHKLPPLICYYKKYKFYGQHYITISYFFKIHILSKTCNKLKILTVYTRIRLYVNYLFLLKIKINGAKTNESIIIVLAEINSVEVFSNVESLNFPTAEGYNT